MKDDSIRIINDSNKETISFDEIRKNHPNTQFARTHILNKCRNKHAPYDLDNYGNIESSQIRRTLSCTLREEAQNGSRPIYLYEGPRLALFI